MIFLQNDYSEGAHPAVLEALVRTNGAQTPGYGEDEYCLEAANLIRKKIVFPKADVHFFSGGTQTNLTALSAFTRPHEAVIACSRAHICVHEAGAAEAAGRKILTAESPDGKLLPEQVEEIVRRHNNVHMVRPRVVYISNATELGTVYRKKELEALHRCCQANGLFLYMDGARLASALVSEDYDLTLPEIARLTDAFYIGGTKNGLLFGEALVIIRDELKPDFRFFIKQRGAMLAKGRLLGIQFKALFEKDLFSEMALHANSMAALLRSGIRELGFGFLSDSVTNQVFPVFSPEIVKGLEGSVLFDTEGPPGLQGQAVRFVTSWATPKEDVIRLLQHLILLARG